MNTGRPSPLRSSHVQQRALILLGGGRTVREAAAVLGIHVNTLQAWVQCYEDEVGPIDGSSRHGEVPAGVFDGTKCNHCGLRNPHVCLPRASSR